MKRHKIVLAFVALNAAILSFAGFAISAAAQAPQLPQPDHKAARINWSSAASADERPQWASGPLSPQKRPPKGGGETPVPIEPRPKTDAELRAELAAKIDREMRLLRIMFAQGRPDQTFAKVRVKGGEVVLATDSGFFDEVPESRVKSLPEWFKDVRTKDIGYDFITLDAPSSQSDKRFDIKVTLAQPGTFNITVQPEQPKQPPKRLPRDKDPGYNRPDRERNEAEPRAKTDTEEDADGKTVIGPSDLENKQALEDAASALRAAVNEKGEAIGLQIAEDTKDDNLLLKRGGKRGDIIKSVNGKAVKTLADAKRLIREDYEKGMREFEVGYERDGNPGTKTFKVAK